MHAYSTQAKLLHWLVAGLIVTQYILAELGELAEDSGNRLNQLAILANHKSIGITILLLAAVRLIVRYRSSAPTLPSSMPRWQQRASNASHTLLYLLLFALPISGWLMSSAKAYSVSWFSLVSLPDLIQPSEAWYSAMHETHEVLGTALLALATLHVMAALKHHFIDRDDILRRMASVVGWWVLVLSIVIGASYFGRLFNHSAPIAPQTTSSIEQGSNISTDILDDIANDELDTNTPSEWNIDYSASYIKFTGDQAGAEFTGTWKTWQATMRFDENALADSRFDVKIDPSSADSGDQERDETISASEFFNATEFPVARFTAKSFELSGSDYLTQGSLTMKGIQKPLTFKFKVSQGDGPQTLRGSAMIDRLAWNIGTGDWRDTSWVGQDVTVEVYVQTLLETDQ